MDVILKKVRRARVRLVVSRFRQLAVYHVAAAAAAATLAAWIVRPGPLLILGSYGVAAGAALVTAALHAAWTRPSIRTAALALDQASGLRERLATALLFRGGSTPAERAVVEDAERAVASADPSLIPLANVRRAWWPAVPPLVFLASLAMPRFASDVVRDVFPDAASSIPVPAPVRKEESTGLRRRAFDLERAAGERDLPGLKELAQAMRQISEDLRRSEMSKAEALTKLSRLEDKVKERKKELSQEAGLRDSHTKRPESGSSSAAGEEAARRAEELDRKIQELKAQLEKAKEELAKAGKDGKSMELQAALDKLGRELEGLDAAKMGDLGKRLEELGQGGDAEALGKMLESLDVELDELEGLVDGLDLLQGELDALQAMKGRVAGDFKACFFCGKAGRG